MSSTASVSDTLPVCYQYSVIQFNRC